MSNTLIIERDGRGHWWHEVTAAGRVLRSAWVPGSKNAAMLDFAEQQRKAA